MTDLSNDTSSISQCSSLSRQLRGSYRELLERVQLHGETMGSTASADTQSGGDVVSMLHATTSLWGSHETQMGAAEMALDSSLMASLAGVCRRRVLNYSTDTLVFSTAGFADRLALYLTSSSAAAAADNDRTADESISDEGAEAWRWLGEQVSCWMPGVPCLRCVYGSLPDDDGAATTTRRSAARRREPPVAASQPQVVSEQTDTESTRREYRRIYHVLKKLHRHNGQQPLCFFQFAYHPTDFALSVENVFHISFLVRDRLVRVFADDGRLLIEPVLAREQADAEAQNKQALMSLCVDEWQAVVQALNISRPMIPPRPAAT